MCMEAAEGMPLDQFGPAEPWHKLTSISFAAASNLLVAKAAAGRLIQLHITYHTPFNVSECRDAVTRYVSERCITDCAGLILTAEDAY